MKATGFSLMSFLVERAFGEVVAGSIMWFTFSNINHQSLGPLVCRLKAS
jgi:hypothetical protein